MRARESDLYWRAKLRSGARVGLSQNPTSYARVRVRLRRAEVVGKKEIGARGISEDLPSVVLAQQKRVDANKYRSRWTRPRPPCHQYAWQLV